MNLVPPPKTLDKSRVIMATNQQLWVAHPASFQAPPSKDWFPFSVEYSSNLVSLKTQASEAEGDSHCTAHTRDRPGSGKKKKVVTQ